MGNGASYNQFAIATVDLGENRTVEKISVGAYNTCAILDDDSLKCWGYGGFGDGTTLWKRSIPTLVDFGTERYAEAVSAGYGHTCVILDDGSLKCWGYNNSGQIGNGQGGTINNALSPVNVELGSNRSAQSVITGGNQTCVILDDDSVKCWGTHGGNTPVVISLGNERTAKNLEMGTDGNAPHVICSILDNDSLLCWTSYGTNIIGLGQDRTAAEISLGYSHSCVNIGTMIP